MTAQAQPDLDLLQQLLDAARRAGADAADAIVAGDTSLSVKRRGGHTEHLERSEARDLGLRVFLGQRSAMVSATSVDPARFADLADRAVAMARVVPDDPWGGLSDQHAPPEGVAALDLVDETEPEATALIDMADAAEAAMLAVTGVTNSDGADAGYGRMQVALATSNGFAGSYARTGFSISATALAGSGVDMQRDYDFTGAVHRADLLDPALIGRRAAERAVARMHPRRPKTSGMTVVFDPRVAGSLLGALAGAINGAAVARGTTFLKDKLGQRIFAPGIQIHDNSRRRRGLRSRPFDAEGVPTRDWALVDDGVLTTWILDQRSARQLGMRSTGHARRGTGGPPSPGPANLYLSPGAHSPADVMADIREGLYVTEMMGGGVNGVTGDYSRGASGFMIRNGQIAEAVAELTVAGAALDMFARMVPADDLQFLRGTDSPTVRIDGLTMGGA